MAGIGVALTARSQYESSLLTTVTFPTITRHMINEQRMWACVVLQAVAEQLSDYVTTNKTGLNGQQTREKAAKAARAYVASEGFEFDCACAGLPVATMRAMLPSKASEAYAKLMSSDTHVEAVIDDEDEDMA